MAMHRMLYSRRPARHIISSNIIMKTAELALCVAHGGWVVGGGTVVMLYRGYVVPWVFSFSILETSILGR